MERKREYKQLSTDLIIETTEKLEQRLEARFPKASLRRLCEDLVVVSNPLIGLRILSVIIVIAILSGTAAMILALKNNTAELTLVEFIQVLEAGINDIVLIGAAIFFLVTLEARAKRRRALEAIHEIRAIAHIIDMHQLTKDPVYVVTDGLIGSAEGERPMTPFELSRYLDYCSEMLSLCGKIAAVYIQAFSDPVAIAAVNEIENLTMGLSRKIWQKMLILEHQMRRGSQLEETEPAFGDERDTLPRHDKDKDEPLIISAR